jgi:periplasmic protein TonB
MAYHFAESEFLSRRAIAAASIIALHMLVAYLLATGLMRTIVALPAPPMAGVVIDPVKRPPPPPLPVIEPNRLKLLMDPIIPPIVNRDDLPESNATITGPQILVAPTVPPTVAAIRVIGKHQLPDTEDYYPADLRRLGIEGAAYVRVCVDESGARRGDPAIEKSSGNVGLDMGAVNIARHGRYARSVRSDTPVANCYRFRIVFEMK